MRSVTNGAKVVKMDAASDLSTNYDAINFNKDTMYVKIECNVLGNKIGLVSVTDMDQSSALAAVYGRKYNNARISFPFTREFVGIHYDEVNELIQDIAHKTSLQCSLLQSQMTDAQIAQGRECAMRSQAIRDAKAAILNSAMIFDGEMFSKANLPIRANVASKVYFNHGVSVSTRRLVETDGLEEKKLFKKKMISLPDGTATQAFVATADEAGLKKIPLFDRNMIKEANSMVFGFAEMAMNFVSQVSKDVTGEECLNCLRNIRDNMATPNVQLINMQPYDQSELNQIEAWKDQILDNYKA